MFNFSRRINGPTYYVGLAGFYLLAVGAAMLASLPHYGTLPDTIIGLVVTAIASVLFVYFICITRQRANDIGWHPLLVTLIAFSTPLSLVIGLFPGQKHKTLYGPVPSRGVRLKP
jgi:uncharacterized membrane protein YhaH (DUF805 family)